MEEIPTQQPVDSWQLSEYFVDSDGQAFNRCIPYFKAVEVHNRHFDGFPSYDPGLPFGGTGGDRPPESFKEYGGDDRRGGTGIDDHHRRLPVVNRRRDQNEVANQPYWHLRRLSQGCRGGFTSIEGSPDRLPPLRPRLPLQIITADIACPVSHGDLAPGPLRAAEGEVNCHDSPPLQARHPGDEEEFEEEEIEDEDDDLDDEFDDDEEDDDLDDEFDDEDDIDEDLDDEIDDIDIDEEDDDDLDDDEEDDLDDEEELDDL